MQDRFIQPLLLSAIAVLLLLLSAVAAIIAVARHHAGPLYTTSCNFTSAWLDPIMKYLDCLR